MLDKLYIFDAIDAQPATLRLNFADSMGDKLSLEMGLGVKNIVFAGMGGSALAGVIVKNWLNECLLVPQSFFPALTIPVHFSIATFSAALAAPLPTTPIAKTPAIAAFIKCSLFILLLH